MKPKIAILDDYQNAALSYADWSAVQEKAEITVFRDHLELVTDIIERLLPFQVVCAMRERTPLSREILSKLPNLQLIVSTGKRNAAIDSQAAEELGISVVYSGYHASGAPELTWALLLGIAKNIVSESARVREGKWQMEIGNDLKGKTLGIVGLGNIGSTIARYAQAFEMDIIAWSENMTAEKAAACGARLLSKDELFATADYISIHLVLSARTKGIVSEKELALMKPTAYLINTSRGPLINEEALIQVLEQQKIAGAALDVYDREPLLPDHPFRKLDNVLATPHIGYVTEDTYRVFYTGTVQAIMQWLMT